MISTLRILGLKSYSLYRYRLVNTLSHHVRARSCSNVVSRPYFWPFIEDSRKIQIEVNSYTNRDNTFWEEMLTNIGKALEREKLLEMDVSLIGVSISSVGSIVKTKTMTPLSPTPGFPISTLNTAKISITLHERLESRNAVLTAVKAINEKLNEHETELTEFMVIYGVQMYELNDDAKTMTSK